MACDCVKAMCKEFVDPAVLILNATVIDYSIDLFHAAPQCDNPQLFLFERKFHLLGMGMPNEDTSTGSVP